MFRVVASLAVVLSFAACGGSAPAPKSCIGAGCVIVTTGHFNPDFTGAGAINTLQLPKQTLVENLDATIDPDVQVITRGEEAMVLNKDTGTVRLYDLRSWTVLAEAKTGDDAAPAASSFPQGMVWLGGHLVVVTLAGNDAAHAAAELDLDSPSAAPKYIAIDAVSDDPDGKPEAGTLYSCSGKLYAALASYSVDMATYQVSYHTARLAIIDAASLKTTGYITLSGKNPASISASAGSCGKVLVTTSGNLYSEPDGGSGIESVDLSKSASDGFLITDQQLGGRATIVHAMSSTLAFVAQWTDLKPNMMGDIYLSSAKVVAINPTAKSVLGDVTKKAGNIAFMAVSPENRLFVGTGLFAGMEEDGKLKKGLYSGAADGTGLSDTPIVLSDTPTSIAFEE